VDAALQRLPARVDPGQNLPARIERPQLAPQLPHLPRRQPIDIRAQAPEPHYVHLNPPPENACSLYVPYICAPINTESRHHLNLFTLDSWLGKRESGRPQNALTLGARSITRTGEDRQVRSASTSAIEPLTNK
jgi:hypothetical protein